MKDDTISRAAALDALDKVAEMFPYRIPGNAKTYRQYNEAWSDAIDAAENALEALPSAQLAQDLPNGCTDTISRQAAISEIMEDIEDRSLHDDPATPEDYAEGYDEGIRNAAAIVLQMPSTQPGWIPCSEKMPPDYQWYYATCKSLVDNRENWVVEGCYTPWEHFNSTPMIKCGEAEVIAWMPKGFPEPWEGDTDAH